MEFLGHKVGRGTISTLEENVHTINAWPIPADLTQLKSFLSLASYYRKSVKEFSSLAVPLCDLVKTNCRFYWTQDCQQAFGSLHRRLEEPPVLIPTDPNLQCFLDTDANNVGLEAVLAQVGRACEKVVGYFSLNKNEQSYSVT